MRIIKKFLAVLLLVIIAVLSVGCSNSKEEQDVEWKFSRKVARKVCEDGWVYTFTHFYFKDGTVDENVYPFQFIAVNLRYRYNEDYTTTIETVENEKHVKKEVPSTIQILGQSNSPAIKRDMEKVAEILDYENRKATPEDLLAINPEDVTFEELDKDIFFGLMHEALNGEPHPEGNYCNLPTYALLEEPEYLSDYKFQIGFVTEMGIVDAIFIDVLYKTGEGYNEYVQLSDLVDNGTATSEQKKAYELIKSISDGIVENNDLMFASKKNEKEEIADIDFSRLYTFLENIEKTDIGSYVVDYPVQ